MFFQRKYYYYFLDENFVNMMFQACILMYVYYFGYYTYKLALSCYLSTDWIQKVCINH